MNNAMMIDNARWIECRAPAMAYVPMQRWGEVFSPARALRHGTLFPILDKPFTGKRQVIAE